MRESIAGRHPRVVSAILWGAVGFMTVLALVQGYALAVEALVTFAQAVVLAAFVGGCTAASAYALEHRIADWSARRAVDETEAHGGDGKSKS